MCILFGDWKRFEQKRIAQWTMDTVALPNPQISQEQWLGNSELVMSHSYVCDSDGIHHEVSNRLLDVECIKLTTFAIDVCLQVASS